MRFLQLLAACFCATLSFSAWAEFTSYHLSNPVGGMYEQPVGENPGWTTDKWFNIEVGASNIWNHSFTMTDRRNGNVYSYFADYENEMAVAELGQAISKHWAIAVEVPYQNHNGGFMDDAVDRFHQLIGSDRFMRDVSPKFGNHYNIQTNGANDLATEHAEGVGNIKAKLKYWMWQVKSPTPGACDCGLSLSFETKFPLQTREHGLSSGHNDYSGLLLAGTPLGQFSGFWATAALTRLGVNDTFAGWPRKDWLQMYEGTLSIGLTAHWGFMLQGRAESPLFNKGDLDFNYTTNDPQSQLEERVSSGYNALVEWRGSQAISLFYRWGQGNLINFLFQEDWGIGNQDQSGDGLYINDAPDYTFMTQWHFAF